MTIEEHISGEIQHYVPGENGASGSWVTYENGALSDANVISASCKRQCCEDGKFTIGGVFAATMQLVCRLPGMTRYQIGNARIVLRSQYAREAEPVPIGTFWATQVSRVKDIFTIRGMDAMGWLDVLAPELYVAISHGARATPYLDCLLKLIFFYYNDAGNYTSDYIDLRIGELLDNIVTITNQYVLADKTGIPDLLSVQPYSEQDNCGVIYANRYRTNCTTYGDENPTIVWQDEGPDTEHPGTTDQKFYFSDKNKNYKCNKPREIMRCFAELFGGFVTVNRSGSFEMRQFCQPSLNIAQIRDADTEEDSLELAEYYMYPRTISAKGQSHFNYYGASYWNTTWEKSITDTYNEPDFTGFDIRLESNILLDGVGQYDDDGRSILRKGVCSFICGIFQAFVRYEDIDYNWDTKTPFPKEQSVEGHIGLFKAYPVPFKCKVHKAERFELGQTVVFPDHPNTFNNYRYGDSEHVPYIRSVITSVEWTFRGGQVLSCGECDTRSMMQLSQDSKADSVLRELHNNTVEDVNHEDN